MGVPLRGLLACVRSFWTLSASLGYARWLLAVLLGLVRMLGFTLSDPPCSTIWLPCCRFAWLFQLRFLPLLVVGGFLTGLFPSSLSSCLPCGWFFRVGLSLHSRALLFLSFPWALEGISLSLLPRSNLRFPP